MPFPSPHFLASYMGCTPIQKQTRLNLIWYSPLQDTTIEFHKSFSLIYKVTVNYFQGIYKEKTVQATLPDWPFPIIRFELWISTACENTFQAFVTHTPPSLSLNKIVFGHLRHENLKRTNSTLNFRYRQRWIDIS